MSRWSDELAGVPARAAPYDTCDSSDTREPQRPQVSPSVTSVRPPCAREKGPEGSETPLSRERTPLALGTLDDTRADPRSGGGRSTAGCGDGSGPWSPAGREEAIRLEALRDEVRAARQVFHAELAALAPILGDIFKEWPGAEITGVVDGPPPSEETGAPRPEPPPPEAVERRAHELLAKAESTIGVEIIDRMKALDYYRARAVAELRRKA
jgi:hypothetical protein